MSADDLTEALVDAMNTTKARDSRTLQLMATITSGLAVLCMAFGMWILTDVKATVVNATNLIVEHVSQPAHAAAAARLDGLERNTHEHRRVQVPGIIPDP